MASEAPQIQSNLNHGCDGDGGTETVGREACSCAAANPEQLSLTEHLRKMEGTARQAIGNRLGAD